MEMEGEFTINSPVFSINWWLYLWGAIPMQTSGGLALIGMYIPTVITLASSRSPQETNTTLPVGPTWSLQFSGNSILTID
jgi:hypothetical protein